MKTLLVPIVAIVGLVVIECFALSRGINGTLMGIVIAAVAGIGGWSLPQLKLKGGDANG